MIIQTCCLLRLFTSFGFLVADQPAEAYKNSANLEPSVHFNMESDNEKSNLQKIDSQKNAASLVHIYDNTSDYELSEGEVRSSSSSSIQTTTAPHSPSDTIVSSTSSGISSSSSLDFALLNRLKRKPISLSDVQSIYEEVDLARSMDQQLIDLHKLRLQQQTQQFVLSQQRLLCPQQPPSKFVPASGIFVTVSVSVFVINSQLCFNSILLAHLYDACHLSKHISPRHPTVSSILSNFVFLCVLSLSAVCFLL